MRLRLNTTLRAALIAAVSTLALATTASAASTGTQTFGEDVVLERGATVFGQDWYVTKDMTAGTATTSSTNLSSSVNITGGNFYAGDYTVSIWVSADSLKSDTLLFAYSGTPTASNPASNGICWNAGDSTITIGRGQLSGSGGSYTGMTWNGTDKKTSGTATLGENEMVNITIAVAGGNQSENATVWVNGVQLGDALGAYAGNMNGGNAGTTMQLFVGAGVTYGNVSITNEKLTTQDSILTLMGLSKTAPSPSTDYIWTGNVSNVWDTEALNWKTSESETPVAFVPGEDNTVTFNASGSKQAVSLAADTTIGSVTVDGAAYTLDLDGHTLTTGTLTVKNTDASLALTGEGTVAAGSIAAADKTINIGEKVVLTGSGSATLDGQGTYALDSGVKAKPAGISLATTWKGTVAITDAQFANSDLLAVNSMCNANSWVLLQGTSGWSPSNTFSANLILKNGTNGWAFAQNNGNDGSVLKFTGSIKGDGNLGRSEGKGSTYTYEFTGDIHDWTGQFISNNNNDKYTLFKVSDKATVVAATLVNNNTGAKSDFRVEVNTNAEFTSTVQATSLTVNDSKAATFSEAISIAKDITVGTGATLNVNGGGSIAKAITNNGTLTFGDDITATGLQITAGATGYVDVNGTFSTDGNGFASNSGDSITIAINGEGATLAANGHVVTQGGVDYTIQEDGTAVAANGSTDYFTYYQTNGAVSTSVITAYAEGKGGVCMFAAVTDAGILNVDSAMGYITADGGEVVFQEGGETDGLVVSDNAKVSGLKDISIMMIDAGKTATLDNQVTSDDVVFSATDGVNVTNTGEVEAITYSLGQTDAKVTADTMTVGGTEEVEVSNSLVVGEIVNNNAKGLILYGNVENGVTLKAAAGDITMVGQTSNTVTVVDLNIASGNTVTLMDTDQEEGTITVTGVLTGGDATLLSNLKLKGGSTLDVNGGGDSALTLGSMLTFDFTDSNGALVNLDDETIAALNKLEDGGKLNLIVAYTEFDPLTYGDNYQGVSYNQLFSAAGLQGDYTVYAQGDAFGLMKSTSPIPEPTTGTLSLLALAALAARRRRK